MQTYYVSYFVAKDNYIHSLWLVVKVVCFCYLGMLYTIIADVYASKIAVSPTIK